MVFRLAVLVSAPMSNYKLLEQVVNNYLSTRLRAKDTVEIIHDATTPIVDRYALDYGFSTRKFRPSHDRHGKNADSVKNLQMARYCDGAVIFWDSYTPSIRDAITKFKALQKDIQIIKI